VRIKLVCYTLDVNSCTVDTFFPPDSGHFEKAHEYVLVSRFLSALVFVCSMNGMLLVGFVCKWKKAKQANELQLKR